MRYLTFLTSMGLRCFYMPSDKETHKNTSQMILSHKNRSLFNLFIAIELKVVFFKYNVKYKYNV